MKTLTKDMVNFTITPQDEYMSIQHALSEKETGTAEHQAYIDKVLLDGGANPWLWCCVKVTAKFEGLKGTTYLGGCAYESEDDFKKGGYYEQMQDEVFEELKSQVDNIINALQ